MRLVYISAQMRCTSTKRPLGLVGDYGCDFFAYASEFLAYDVRMLAFLLAALRRDMMAKGQQRKNKEVKKPKQEKKPA
jgi:hypothetical protein